MTQFAFMRSPDLSSGFEVGDTVEVLCDHEKNDRPDPWMVAGNHCSNRPKTWSQFNSVPMYI